MRRPHLDAFHELLFTLLLFALPIQAIEPMCGTSPENDARIRAADARSRGGVRAMAAPEITLREGAFYIRNNETITTGYRPFDLTGQSLVFTPSGSGAFKERRESLHYTEPAGGPVRQFQGSVGDNWYSTARDLGFTFPVFGRNVTRIYITAFNSIHFEPPVEQTGWVFDALETAVHRGAVLSPLMITARKPRFLEYPRVYVDERPGAVVITWRSSADAPFGYDVQAELKSDGTITYSYRSVTGMRWGTPVLSPGLDPATVPRALLQARDDTPNDVTSNTPEAIRAMLDIRRTEVLRLRDSDLLAIRIQLAEPIDRTKIAEGQTLRYQAQIEDQIASVEIDRNEVRVISFTGLRYEVNGASAQVDGNVIEIYGIQIEPATTASRTLRVSSYYRPPSGGSNDQSVFTVAFPAAPRVTTRDLSAVSADAELLLPVAEPFLLGVFNPYVVWDALQTAHGTSDFTWDGVVMYQTFYTDIIFFAGAYATGGNAQVDGIANFSPFSGSRVPRAPTLLHLNQLTYNYSVAEDTASKLLLHEFGHRWLYFISILENGQTGRFLNPVSPHPAAYVHTPAAFPVYGGEESSVMGGAYFTTQADGKYRAHAANMGYSWTDLYLMGLAAPEEVPPWFYLANTNLPREYWPAEGVVVDGEKHDVSIGQVTSVHGKRNPSTAISERRFRVLFVLVTEAGQSPTEAEVAKLNEWRAVMERNFAAATGGRASLETTYVEIAKKRAVRR
jgi:hypothetical protein